MATKRAKMRLSQHNKQLLAVITSESEEDLPAPVTPTLCCSFSGEQDTIEVVSDTETDFSSDYSETEKTWDFLDKLCDERF